MSFSAAVRSAQRIFSSFIPLQPRTEESGATPPVIWWITHEFSPFRGGAGVYVQEIARAAAKLAIPSRVVTVDYHGRLNAVAQREMHRSDAAEAYPLVRLKCDGRLTPAGVWRLTLALYRLRGSLQTSLPVLLSVGAQMAAFLLHAIGQFPARRTICFFHGSELLRFGRHPLWRPLARSFYAQAAGFAVASRHVQELAARSGLLPPGADICLASCAVPSAYQDEDRRPADAARTLRQEADQSDETIRILTVGRLHPRKGQLQVAQALALLPVAERQRLVYCLVGTGDSLYGRQVEAVCREAEIRVEFAGDIDSHALAGIYARCTVYAQASQTLPQSLEGFGISLLEAGFFGCPIAAFRSGGVAEAVAEGANATLVEEGDVADLSAAIASLIGDPALRSRYSVAGRTFAEAFSWAKSARLLCGLAYKLNVLR